MDISGINSSWNKTVIENTKKKSVDGSFEAALKAAAVAKDEKQLRAVCQDFEAILLNMMYKEMKAAVPKSDLIPADSGREIFESMFDEKLVEGASKGRGSGLADVLYKQLGRQLKSNEAGE